MYDRTVADSLKRTLYLTWLNQAWFWTASGGLPFDFLLNLLLFTNICFINLIAQISMLILNLHK